jgi:nucleotide-binding universal stress UspA family protein
MSTSLPIQDRERRRMSDPILVPLDGSTLAQRALPYAARLARGSARPLLLVRVLSPRPAWGEPLVQEPEASADLNANAEPLRAEGLAVRTVVTSTLRGDLAQAILEIAQSHGCGLIVMSTHGRSGLGRWIYGSVADEVLRHASMPIVLVPATSNRQWRENEALRVLVPFDGSTFAEAALEPMLASIPDVVRDVLLLRVVVPARGGAAAYMFEDLPSELENARESLEKVAETLRNRGWAVRVQVVLGSVAASVTDVARRESIDLVGMATHGRSGLARLALGSAATETLQLATMPVLVLRPGGLVESRSAEPSAIDIPEHASPFTLLVALDATDKANAALAPTARIARATGARVVLVNAIRTSTDLGHVHAPRRAAIEYVRSERRLYLDQKARQLAGVEVETRVEVLAHGEEIDERIAAVATEIGADLVMVVSKRVSSTSGVIIGSFAQGIVSRSPCPVLIVAPTAKDARNDEPQQMPLQAATSA